MKLRDSHRNSLPNGRCSKIESILFLFLGYKVPPAQQPIENVTEYSIQGIYFKFS